MWSVQKKYASTPMTGDNTVVTHSPTPRDTNTQDKESDLLYATNVMVLPINCFHDRSLLKPVHEVGNHLLATEKGNTKPSSLRSLKPGFDNSY